MSSQLLEAFKRKLRCLACFVSTKSPVSPIAHERLVSPKIYSESCASLPFFDALSVPAQVDSSSEKKIADKQELKEQELPGDEIDIGECDSEKGDESYEDEPKMRPVKKDQYSIVVGACHEMYLYGEQGWGRKQPLETIGADPQFVAMLTPPQNNQLCFSLFHRLECAGQFLANEWCSYLQHLGKTFSTTVTTNAKNLKYATALAKIYSKELELKSFLEREFANNEALKGISLDKIVHRCGTMIMQRHCGQGLGSEIMQTGDLCLKMNGYKVVILKTINAKSTRMALRNNYKLFHAFDYARDLDVSVGGDYVIWYKYL